MGSSFRWNDVMLFCGYWRGVRYRPGSRLSPGWHLHIRHPA